MARYIEPTQEQLTGWNEWLASRPEVIQKLAARFDPWSLYKMKSTGHLVSLYSFDENNTVTVNVTGEFNILTHSRRVFGIDPDDLEPAEIPKERGMTLIPDEEVENHIDVLRVSIRPDLWKMGEDGKAIWIGEGANPFIDTELNS